MDENVCKQYAILFWPIRQVFQDKFKSQAEQSPYKMLLNFRNRLTGSKRFGCKIIGIDNPSAGTIETVGSVDRSDN